MKPPFKKLILVASGIFLLISIYFFNSGNFYNLIQSTSLIAALFLIYKVFDSKKEKENFEELKKFQLAVKNASDMIVITDPDGKIVFANKAAEKITGFKTEEMVGKNPRLWGGKMDKEFYETMWTTIKNNKSSFRGELINRRKNQEEYFADLHISPVIDEEKVLFFVGIERDITKEKQIDKAKTEFVTLASHQLRTPLTSIVLTSELLLRGISGEINLKQTKYLEEIHNSTKNMTELVESLLNISRIELGTFKFNSELFQPVEMTKKIITELKGQIDKKEIHFKTEFNDIVPGISYDKNVFRMVVENLLTNAIRYTPKNGNINIAVIKTEDEVQLIVKDSGCGIPESAKSKIFSKTFRAENAQQITSEGTGLGLYMIKSICEKIGSKIWFESEENKGSTFYFSIPTKN